MSGGSIPSRSCETGADVRDLDLGLFSVGNHAGAAHGASNKEAGRTLGISPRTIEVHRARIMEKLDARNTADLARIVFSERER